MYLNIRKRLQRTNDELPPSLKHFAFRSRAPGPTWTEATKRKAPHIPLQLLAELDLVNRCVITSRS